MNNKSSIELDIVILGGGIAGLWALNRLHKLGYQAILLETHTLGGGQTIKSQGIIHGGIKYTLSGFLNGSANAIETMPQRWKDALQGTGELDLRRVNILSHDQLLCSTGSLGSEIASFFASKALNSRVQKLPEIDYPPFLKNPAFKGHAYRLAEIVLDTHSLIETLAKPHQNSIFKINPHTGYTFITDPNNPLNILSLKIFSGTQTVELKAKRYLLTAGEGNEALALKLPNAPQMQRRPLQMTMLKLPTPSSFFAHCIDNGTNPRITITTHPTKDGKTVWYLGGQLAEDGANRSKADQIAAAKKELQALFPWLDLSTATWASFFVNRAEPKQPGGKKRPDNAFIETLGNVMIAWPTKLALAPVLSDQVITLLKQQNIQPLITSVEKQPEFIKLTTPEIALPPWDTSTFQ